MAECPFCYLEMKTADGCVKEDIVFKDRATAPQVKLGEEAHPIQPDENGRCPDCGCKVGFYHHPGCNLEECPRCHDQLLSCDCL